MKVIEITLINEMGERITYNLETKKHSPEGISIKSYEDALRYVKAFADGGNMAIRRISNES